MQKQFSLECSKIKTKVIYSITLANHKRCKQSNDSIRTLSLTLSLPETVMETCTCGVVLTFEYVDKILRCDHSNQTSSAVLLYGNIRFAIFKIHKL